MTSPWEDEAPAAAQNDPTLIEPGVFSFSAKTGTGYEAGLINYRGPIEDLAGYLGVGLGADKQEALANVTKAWNKFHHFAQKDYAGHGPAPSATPKSSGGSAPARDSGRPSNANEPPEWAPKAPYCEHGQKRYVTKIGSKGRWHAWGCPGPKHDQCDDGLEFFNQPK